MNLTLRHSHIPLPPLSLLLFPLEHSVATIHSVYVHGVSTRPRVAVNIRSRSRDRDGRTSREEGRIVAKAEEEEEEEEAAKRDPLLQPRAQILS